MNNTEIATLLNGLVEISRDRADSFKTCANNVSDPALKLFFVDRAQSCEEAVKALSVEVIHYSGNPDASRSTEEGLLRILTNLKTVFTKKNNLAVLEECEMGEAAAVMAYENALRQEIPDSLRALLERLYEGVKRNHEHVVRQLRDEARNNPNLA
ncbi:MULTISPECIES: PA2169 family four-helix-bundle protein [Nitrosomonas]|uniref:Aldehyde dehydrogenase n=1 Tax=Nitrosomonas communis TaxID=44574 RepID=A0A0F7KDL2_9PROT|nr:MULTISPECIES: PA2169 family four-helix-bundle protein [Nitrosomonas]AKH37243.1 aldehyde dehydrogenase [Nitrosomonas communis]TYP71043.1 uncharacterized protein (TIGR02284 family) [Nitrosomonas communis]UVS62441.1 PA2169 family four-helix-bundle protein [Nitrosomonas sp. PLL12]